MKALMPEKEMRIIFQKGEGSMTDSEIIGKMFSEPDEGFRLLFDEYHQYVYTIAYNILRKSFNSHDIKECVVDVMSDVMMNYDRNNEGSLKAYIGTVAKNHALDMCSMLKKSSARNIAIDDVDVTELASDVNVEEQIENSELARTIIKVMKGMGSPDYEIMIQKYFFDRNSSEIAKVLKLNPITVRSRCRRALKRLKATLTEMNIKL